MKLTVGTFLLTILLIFLTSQVFAQTPPKLVVKALKDKFPSAVNIKWAKAPYHEDNCWEASFNLRNKKATATFTSDGHWIRTNVEISISELREEVWSAIKEDYSGCEIVTIKMGEDVALGTAYEVKFKCGDKILFEVYSSNGHRIRM